MKIKRHKEGIPDFPSELLEDNASTVKEQFHTQAMLVSRSKAEEYKTDSNSGAQALQSKLMAMC